MLWHMNNQYYLNKRIVLETITKLKEGTETIQAHKIIDNMLFLHWLIFLWTYK